ncbi:hypothetical protein B0H13DRAFT_1860293 [Mycena leptocephala]|nr:hypothetical protein B0H13DRAFT_1860293 [Mycena leptocephala]
MGRGQNSWYLEPEKFGTVRSSGSPYKHAGRESGFPYNVQGQLPELPNKATSAGAYYRVNPNRLGTAGVGARASGMVGSARWSFFYPGVASFRPSCIGSTIQAAEGRPQNLTYASSLFPPSRPDPPRSVIIARRTSMLPVRAHAEAGARSSSWYKLLDSDTPSFVPDEVSFNWGQRTRPEIVALALSVGRKVMRITSVSGALDGGLMGHALRQGRPPPVLYDIAFARCGFCARASEEADPAFLKEVVRSHGARLSYHCSVIGPAGLSISCATSTMAIEEANEPLR